MNKAQGQIHFMQALKDRDILYFLSSVGFFTLASRALIVVIGFQIYQITHSALSLGWLGLIEAIPALSLVLVGGWVADHYNRRTILLITRLASFLCALGLVILSVVNAHNSILGFYVVIFIAGIARAFADPANTAFEAQVVPKSLIVNAASWISSVWMSGWIIGPAIIGFVFDSFGALGSYILISTWFFISFISTLMIGPKPQFKPQQKEPMLKSMGMGWKFIFKNPALLGAMSLDLFAVLFGGAISLLPIFANDILHVGAKGLGLLNAAPSVGALVIMLISTHYAPRIINHAGRNLLLTVLGFGISILIFAFSKNFWFSMGALFFTGIFDGISMVIRRSIVRLLSPDDMRGRISAASWIFICSSNELGAFESGMLAALIGTVPCVAVGGIVTLGVVGLTAYFAPALRRLRFDPQTMARV